MKNADILHRIGCVPTPRGDGSYDFLLPLSAEELAAIRAALPADVDISTVTGPRGLCLRFRPDLGLTRDILALANLRGVTSENVQGDGI